jgi:ABC-type transport system involved in cytochrome bd biosynthesis fused ATPase/permease subunit
MSVASGPQREETVVVPLLLVLLIVLILFGVGFAVEILWILAAVVLAIWLVGFFARGAEGARWYRW